MAKVKTKAKAKPKAKSAAAKEFAKAATDVIMGLAKPKHAGGRPTDYGPHVLEITKDYYTGGYKTDGHSLPMQAGLCMRLDCAKSTLQLWSKEYEEFSALLAKGQAILEMCIANGGTVGGFNPTFTGLVAANTLDWRSSKADIDHKSSDGTMSPTKIAIVAG